MYLGFSRRVRLQRGSCGNSDKLTAALRLRNMPFMSGEENPKLKIHATRLKDHTPPVSNLGQGS
ncbi:MULTISPECIES: hypothetical protein [unclassified Leisingera]|uniref:hypothetical protein n=1 Tax=unclassified Leisingera TaxID=2614906 RepID=UPI0003148625|nr:MULTISPECIES: hypothetical protein [unclassified Leisingera]